MNKKISTALISVFYKDGLEPVVRQLHAQGAIIYSTGGTQKFIEDLSIPVVPVEQLTSYPSILGGRVKTLHPLVFGGGSVPVQLAFGPVFQRNPLFFGQGD